MGRRILEKVYPLETGNVIGYRAEDVRRERTGIHAKVAILLNRTGLSWSNFNVERDEERTRLANSADKALNELDRVVWPARDMKHALDRFCFELWDLQMGGVNAALMAGDHRAGGPCYYARPYVIEGGGTIIFAKPGSGKSFTGMLLAVSIDAGITELFDSPVAIPTLYLNIERSQPSMADRLARINGSLGLESNRPLHFINERGKRLADIAEAAQRYIEREGIGCVVYDSISRSGYGDLNENQATNKIIDTLNELCPTWVGLAHTPRADESHIYGSVHFDAGVDIAVQLKSERAEGQLTTGIALQVTKSNDGPSGGKPLLYALEFEDGGLAGVRAPRNREFPTLLARTLQEIIDDHLLMVGEATASQIADEYKLPRPHVSTYLANSSRHGRKRQGHEMYYHVLAMHHEEQVYPPNT